MLVSSILFLNWRFKCFDTPHKIKSSNGEGEKSNNIHILFILL